MKRLRQYDIYCDMQEERGLDVKTYSDWVKEVEEEEVEYAAVNWEIDHAE